MLLAELRACLGGTPRRMRPLRGGCIHTVLAVELEGNETVVVKQNADAPPDHFAAEADGLRRLAATGLVRTPEVLAVHPRGIVLRYIAPGPETDHGWETLGRSLAALHGVRGPGFGYERDNYLGLWPQANGWTADGLAFFRERRLEPLLRTLPLSEQEARAARWLLDHLEELLAGCAEEPVLLHGDLWSGNVHFDAHGRAWLLDPAVYYGWREAELAFTRLFGGFPDRFYRAYEEAHPLKPGFSERMDLYNLYPLLVHWKLFGASYRSSVRLLLRRYVPFAF